MMIGTVFGSTISISTAIVDLVFMCMMDCIVVPCDFEVDKHIIIRCAVVRRASTCCVVPEPAILAATHAILVNQSDCAMRGCSTLKWPRCSPLTWPHQGWSQWLV